jgi:DNA polymerase-4
MKKIIHIDADCFYAAIEMRENLDLCRLSVAVGGDPGRRGVGATCNYNARRLGIRSAMDSAYAKKLCPVLVIIPPRIDFYKRYSRELLEIFSDYTATVESLPLDEAWAVLPLLPRRFDIKLHCVLVLLFRPALPQ